MSFGNLLFLLGVLFPIVSLLSAVASAWESWRTGRSSSCIFLPFVGPILLTVWVFVEGHSRWVLLAVWGLDLGTIAFLIASPMIVKDLWRTAPFNVIMTLSGQKDSARVEVRLYRDGRYGMMKKWNRAEGEVGIVGLGDLGTYTDHGEGIELTSHVGLTRKFARTESGFLCVDEDGNGRVDLENYSLKGWLLRSPKL